MLYKTLRKWIKTLHLKSLFFSILLVLVVLYPNLYLAGKQATTQIRGIDSLVDPDDPQVIILAEEAMLSEQVQSGDLTIEAYVLSVIEYASDYDQYYNLDYWAPPAETLQSRVGDCEDLAIVVKSVQEYLGEDSKLVIQPRHVYIEQNGIVYGGKSSIDSYSQAVYETIKSIPSIRKIIIFVGLILLWGYNPIRRLYRLNRYTQGMKKNN